MTTAHLSLHRVRAVLVCSVLLSAGTLGAPGAAYAGACSGGSGVTVVVDFGPYGGVQTGCASDPTNGLSALSQAGFSSVMVTSQPGFVCRINGSPPAEDEACVRTPPETSYWAYWQAPPGSGSWTYSGQGAASTQPHDGGTEGWAFGAGGQPGIAPPVNTAAPPPPPPSPTTTTSTTTTSTRASTRPPVPPPAAGTSAAPDPATSGPPGGTDPAGTTAPPGQNSSSPTTSAQPAGSSTSPPNRSVEIAAGGRDEATDTGGTGAPWSLVVAGVVAAALGSGAYWQIRRRQ